MTSAKLYNKRLGNNVIANLETIMAEIASARPYVDQLEQLAERKMDGAMLIGVLKVKAAILEIERRARDARQARFEEDERVTE